MLSENFAKNITLKRFFLGIIVDGYNAFIVVWFLVRGKCIKLGLSL